MTSSNLDRLSDQESAELRFLVLRFTQERKAKNYAFSDALRNQLIAAGVRDPSKPVWHPVFEQSGYRMKRAIGRLVNQNLG